MAYKSTSELFMMFNPNLDEMKLISPKQGSWMAKQANYESNKPEKTRTDRFTSEGLYYKGILCVDGKDLGVWWLKKLDGGHNSRYTLSFQAYE